MQKQLFKMIFVVVFGLISANSAFAMLGPDESPNDLADVLLQEIEAAQGEQGRLRQNIITLDSMKHNAVTTAVGRINLELCKAKAQLGIDRLERENIYRHGIIAILENDSGFINTDPNIRTNKRQAFNEFATQDANTMQAEVDAIDAKIDRLGQAIEMNDAQAKKAILQEVTGQPMPQNNNNPALTNGGKKDTTQQKQAGFFIRNRGYITGAVIIGTIAGTVYFHGKRIKKWVASKLDRRTKLTVKKNK